MLHKTMRRIRASAASQRRVLRVLKRGLQLSVREDCVHCVLPISVCVLG